jgi:CRP/FNR family transcriptional regulator, cyclic AMP receptor protein
MRNGTPDLLTGIAPEEMSRVLSLGSRMILTSGAELFHMGAPADSLYLVVRGRVKLTLPMQVRGQVEDVLVDECLPGQTVGWSALIPPYRFTLTATASLETEVLALSREALREHFEAFPAVGYAVSLNLASVIGQRLQLFQTMWLRGMQRVVELRCA